MMFGMGLLVIAAQAVQYGNDLTVTNCTITGLASGTVYYVWVKAKNSGGSSGFSAPANVILPPGIPVAPVLISGANQLTAAWTAVTGATFYEVWFGTSNDSSTACLFGTVTTPACTITGLASGTVYYIWVQAGNSSGTSGFSLAANQITIPDPPVPSLTAASNQLTVTWDAVTGATAYQVWYGTTSNSGAAVQYGNNLTATTCTITGLTSGATYYVWLTSLNSGGCSGFSASANTTLPYTGSITGLVNSDTGFTVTLAEINSTLSFSDSNYFTFNNLAPGTYYVRIEKDGYPSVIKTAIVPVDGTVNLGTIDLTTLSPLPTGAGADQVSWNWNSGPYPQYCEPDITNSFSLDLTVPTTFNIQYQISNNDLTSMRVMPLGTSTMETYNGWNALIYNYGSTTPVWQLQVGYQQSQAGSTSFVLPAGNYSFTLGRSK